MSEANNVWRVELDGREHEIEIEHTMMDKHKISVDGEVIDERRNWRFKGAEHAFDLGGHKAEIKIDRTYGGMGSSSTLRIDGRYVEPLNR